MALYTAINAALPASNTASVAPVKISTSTTTALTVLQLTIASSTAISIVEWGISFDGAAPAQAIECELFNTTVAATSMASASVTGLDSAGLQQTAATTAQYWKTGQSEGTVANYHPYDLQLVDPAIGYFKQFPSDVRPYGAVSTYVRIRVTAAAAVNCYAYVTWLE